MRAIIITFFAILLLPGSGAFGQLNLPNASPDAELKQQVGFTTIEVKYSRPAVRGRIIFGELVPFGELWRTGAHDATTISFSDTVKLNGNVIPAGNYSFFTIPGQNEWTIILNKETEMHGTSEYTEEKDLVRFKVLTQKSSRFYETFTIEINDIIKDAGTLYLIWENTQVAMTIHSNADEVVMAEINERINLKKEERAGLYYQASLYYFNNNKDLNQALEWIRIANKNTQDAVYLQLQAKLEGASGNYEAAIKTARLSSELAKSRKLEGVIASNEKYIQEWNTKSKKN